MHALVIYGYGPGIRTEPGAGFGFGHLVGAYHYGPGLGSGMVTEDGANPVGSWGATGRGDGYIESFRQRKGN